METAPRRQGDGRRGQNRLPVSLWPAGAAPVPRPLRVDDCQVFVGTCSWADRGLVRSDFYPRGARTDPQARLQHYASVFPTVEVDASYHALQPPERARQWLAWTPSSFRFNVKAFAWLTGHESDPRRLPPGIAALLPAALRQGGPVAGGQVHGEWPGLEPEQLHEGRDLALTTDFRDIFAEVVARHLGAERLDRVFPGYPLDPKRYRGVLG